MFTGIIEELGSVRSVEQRGDNARIVIDAKVVIDVPLFQSTLPDTPS